MTYGIDETNKVGVQNVKIMIGEGSCFPSTTTEKEMINSSNVKLKKKAEVKTTKSERKSKSIPIIHPQ